MNEKRRTLNNIALDIIKQRVENINRNASFNRSMHDLQDDAAVAGYDDLNKDLNKITPDQLDTVVVAPKSAAVAAAATPPTAAIGSLKPLKRKLFAPPSLFPEHSPIGLLTPQKTDTKKTAVNQKRKRNDVGAAKEASSTLSKSDEKKKPTEKPRTNNTRKTMGHSRRSTMFFETPPAATPAATAAKTATQSSTSATSDSTAIRKLNAITTPSLVFTSMHQPQIDFITEVRQG